MKIKSISKTKYGICFGCGIKLNKSHRTPHPLALYLLKHNGKPRGHMVLGVKRPVENICFLGKNATIASIGHRSLYHSISVKMALQKNPNM